VKRKEYTSRGEKQADFFIGFLVMAGLLILWPVLAGTIPGTNSDVALGWISLVGSLGFLIGAGIYRPWMAIGGLGCLGTLIGLGLLAAIFIAVVCSSAFR
jgi:hypothetical protein